MTKEELISLVKSSVLFGDSSADTSKRLHDVEVEGHIELAIKTMLVRAYMQGVKMGNYSLLDPFTKPFMANPIYDNLRKDYYIELPAPVVTFNNNEGIRLVCYLENQANTFDYINNNAVKSYLSSEISMLPNQKVYLVENNAIRFLTKDNYFDKAKIMLKLVIPFSAYDYDEEVYLPLGADMDIITIIRQQLQGRTEKVYDNKNNNNSNVETK